MSSFEEFRRLPAGYAEDQALLVGRERGRGEVRHGGLLAAQGRSPGKEVKAIAAGPGRCNRHSQAIESLLLGGHNDQARPRVGS